MTIERRALNENTTIGNEELCQMGSPDNLDIYKLISIFLESIPNPAELLIGAPASELFKYVSPSVLRDQMRENSLLDGAAIDMSGVVTETFFARYTYRIKGKKYNYTMYNPLARLARGSSKLMAAGFVWLQYGANIGEPVYIAMNIIHFPAELVHTYLTLQGKYSQTAPNTTITSMLKESVIRAGVKTPISKVISNGIYHFKVNDYLDNIFGLTDAIIDSPLSFLAKELPKAVIRSGIFVTISTFLGDLMQKGIASGKLPSQESISKVTLSIEASKVFTLLNIGSETPWSYTALGAVTSRFIFEPSSYKIENMVDTLFDLSVEISILHTCNMLLMGLPSSNMLLCPIHTAQSKIFIDSSIDEHIPETYHDAFKLTTAAVAICAVSPTPTKTCLAASFAFIGGYEAISYMHETFKLVATAAVVCSFAPISTYTCLIGGLASIGIVEAISYE
jgi:hypothetical protein